MLSVSIVSKSVSIVPKSVLLLISTSNLSKSDDQFAFTNIRKFVFKRRSYSSNVCNIFSIFCLWSGALSRSLNVLFRKSFIFCNLSCNSDFDRCKPPPKGHAPLVESFVPPPPPPPLVIRLPLTSSEPTPFFCLLGSAAIN